MYKHAKEAKMFVEAVKTMAKSQENLDNMEYYLSCHFAEWLEKYANTPATLARELYEFANMEI